MKLSRIRRALYGSARALGDAQALERAAETGTARPIAKRIVRRAAGRAAGKFLRWLTR